MLTRRFQRVLVCFATEAEAGAFRRVAREISGVTILLTGIGPENAGATVRRALDSNPHELVISSGFAGGLDPKVPHGTLIFASDDPALQQRLAALGARQVRFHTARRIATTVNEKHALRESTQADAVEMESGAIQTLCTQRQIPFAILRIISDAANEDLPLDFNRLMKPDMSLSYLHLAGQLLCSPGKIGELRVFQKRVAECARLQAGLLASLIVHLRTLASGTP
jgi:adenosylhomocysteine nucleosidase